MLALASLLEIGEQCCTEQGEEANATLAQVQIKASKKLLVFKTVQWPAGTDGIIEKGTRILWLSSSELLPCDVCLLNGRLFSSSSAANNTPTKTRKENRKNPIKKSILAFVLSLDFLCFLLTKQQHLHRLNFFNPFYLLSLPAMSS